MTILRVGPVSTLTPEERAQYLPHKGPRRVFLIDHVDRANEQAANSPNKKFAVAIPDEWIDESRSLPVPAQRGDILIHLLQTGQLKGQQPPMMRSHPSFQRQRELSPFPFEHALREVRHGLRGLVARYEGP